MQTVNTMRIQTLLVSTAVAMLILTTSFALASPRPAPFILGADISWVPEDEADGAQYFDLGTRKDILQILKDHGFNAIRLRVFVDPSAPRGYAAGRPEAFCDLAHVLAMAKRVKAADMGLLISFHYADTWTNPEGHPKPHAWANYSVDELAKAVHDHTFEVLSALKVQGTPADMAAIGNEITHGMLWPDGRVWSHIPSGNAQTDAANANLGAGNGNFDDLAKFLSAGIAAAREVDPRIQTMVHHSLGRHKDRVVEWVDQLAQRGVNADIIGLSCYSQSKEGDWQATMNEVVHRWPDKRVVAAEYSARKRYLNDCIFAVPDNKGLGSFIWEPTRHREALFDQNGINAGGGQANNFITTAPTTREIAAVSRPTTRRTHGGRYDANDLMDLYPQMAKDYTADGPGSQPQPQPEH